MTPEDFAPGWIEKIAEAQACTHVEIGAALFPRRRWGSDRPDIPSGRYKPYCPDCGCSIGQLHEACAVCGAQAFGCKCLVDASWVITQ